jgi:MOSC domain-containing protein YiiM
MKLSSIQVATPRRIDVADRAITTGIFKEPVSRYARVIRSGEIEIGMGVLRQPSTSNVSVLEIFDLVYDTTATQSRLRRALEAPIAERGRADLERRLARMA